MSNTITIVKDFYNSSVKTNYNDWKSLLSRYDSIVSFVDEKKRKSGLLIELDSYWQNEYVHNVKEREYLTLEELSKIMKWKLLRGKFRPLQKLVDSNSEVSVKTITKRAFEFLNIEEKIEENWTNVFNALTELKGIGEATASALLAPIFPKYFPFMSDEVIEITCPKREYTRKAYSIVRSSLIEKANQLNNLHEDEYFWSSEDVGKAIWVKSMIHIHSIPDIIESQTKRKIEINVNNSGNSTKKKRS